MELRSGREAVTSKVFQTNESIWRIKWQGAKITKRAFVKQTSGCRSASARGVKGTKSQRAQVAGQLTGQFLRFWLQREGRARCRRHRRLIAQRWAHAKSSFANAGRCRPQSRLCCARVNGLVPKNKGQRALWGWPHLFSARIDKRAKVSERPFSSLGEICKLVLANWKGGGF